MLTLIISLTKEVPDEATGQQLYETVAAMLEPYPDVKMSGRMNQSLILPEPPE